MVDEVCAQCGEEKADVATTCSACEIQNKLDCRRIQKLQKQGHDEHCAYRIVWGDGECECGHKGAIVRYGFDIGFESRVLKGGSVG